ncbi:MAG: transglutaminase domain-containing protein [Chloroflexota bacterium]|nr:MAG: transglutaminase domain-containing protein [Chloroflexota bacterium]
MKRILAIGLVVILVLTILSTTAYFAYTWLPAKIHYHVTKSFLISQSADSAQVYLGILIPRSGPYQTVDDLNIGWDGQQERKSLPNVDSLKLWSQIGEGKSLEANIGYDIILPQGAVSWNAPIEKFQLLPQAGIESDHPEIREIAGDLSTSSEKNRVYRIYRFTCDHLDYSQENCEETNVSAIEALQSGLGACIGYSRLMVALCRAAGIPAQMIIGSVLPDIFLSLPQTLSTGIPGGGHAWVEYSSEGKWYLVDPSWGEDLTPTVAFNRNDGRHLSFGEFEQFTNAKEDLNHWATDQAQPLDNALSYIFAARGGETKITPTTIIKKTWDGRWINTLLCLGIVTILLCKIRDSFFKNLQPT